MSRKLCLNSNSLNIYVHNPASKLYFFILTLVNNVCFDVELTTKSWANEISWSIGSCSNNRVYNNYNSYTQKCCLTPGQQTLTCKDKYGDGWHGGFIEIYGRRYCQDFTSGKDLTQALTIGINPPQRECLHRLVK